MRDASEDSRDITQRLVDEIGSHHFDIDIDEVYDSIVSVFKKITSKSLKLGSNTDQDAALRDVKERVSMVLTHLMAALTPWTREQNGQLLVLSSASSDDALTGTFTSYGGKAAGDVNPVGGLNKVDLKAFLNYYSKYTGKKVFDEMAQFKNVEVVVEASSAHDTDESSPKQLRETSLQLTSHADS